MNVFQLMLDCWNAHIFSEIKRRLQDSAMKLVLAERNGEAFNSQLVIGVRESYGASSQFFQVCYFFLIFIRLSMTTNYTF